MKADSTKKVVIPWSDEEKQELRRWLESGWDWEFPGYGEAAFHINEIFNNNRSASACRSMDSRIYSK